MRSVSNNEDELSARLEINAQIAMKMVLRKDKKTLVINKEIVIIKKNSRFNEQKI